MYGTKPGPVTYLIFNSSRNSSPRCNYAIVKDMNNLLTSPGPVMVSLCVKMNTP